MTARTLSYFRPPSITFRPQPTSSSLGLGRAETASSSSDDGSSSLKTTLRATRKTVVDNDANKPMFDTLSLIAQHDQQQQQQQQHQHLFFSARSQTPFHHVSGIFRFPCFEGCHGLCYVTYRPIGKIRTPQQSGPICNFNFLNFE